MEDHRSKQKLPPALRAIADAALGFMPRDEGNALYRVGLGAAKQGPMLEIGSYCGKSTVYLGAAAQRRSSVLFSVDHHRGSEEHQPGEEYHDPSLLDAEQRVDTLPAFRSTIAAADLEQVVVAVVGRSETVALHWSTPLSLVFIDGGHSESAARADYEGWARHLQPGGVLAIHDVFEDRLDWGRAPRLIYELALQTQAFEERPRVGSLRILQRIGGR